MRLLLYLLWAIGLPACPCTPTCWHPGLVAEGSAWVLEEPRVPEVGRGNCGDEKAARLILQRRKLAQRQHDVSKATRQVDGEAFASALGSCFPLGASCPAHRGPPAALDTRLGQEHTHQNSPSSCTVTPIFSRSLLLTFCHSSELGCEHRGGES